MTRYDTRTALVAVDVQNDFADPQGSLSVPGAEAAVDAVNGEIKEAQAVGSLVVYTQDWHPPDTPHFAKDGGPWPVHCVRDTWGAAFHPALVVVGESVQKGRHGEDGYSGFRMRDPVSGQEQSTGLVERLREAEIGHVVVVGLATDYCVKATALDAVAEGFETTVVRAAVAAVDVQPGDGDRALAEMVAAGVHIA